MNNRNFIRLYVPDSAWFISRTAMLVCSLMRKNLVLLLQLQLNSKLQGFLIRVYEFITNTQIFFKQRRFWYSMYNLILDCVKDSGKPYQIQIKHCHETIKHDRIKILSFIFQTAWPWFLSSGSCVFSRRTWRLLFASNASFPELKDKDRYRVWAFHCSWSQPQHYEQGRRSQ